MFLKSFISFKNHSFSDGSKRNQMLAKCNKILTTVRTALTKSRRSLIKLYDDWCVINIIKYHITWFENSSSKCHSYEAQEAVSYVHLRQLSVLKYIFTTCVKIISIINITQNLCTNESHVSAVQIIN